MDTQITKLCPQCNHSMMRAGKFFFCAECGCSAPFEETKKVDVEKQYPSRYVFLSYGHDQYATFAHKLKDDLIKRGHIVWTDQELKIGNDWETNIEEALNKAINNKPNSCFLLLMSPYSIRRPDGYCLNELAKAIRWGIFTLPIRLDQVEPPLSIARVQVLDMSECVCPEEVEAIYQRQLNLLFNALENDQIDFDGTQAYLINKLQPIEFKSEVKKYLQDFTGRQWILDTINTWLSDENGSRVFWLTGGPGVGKTAISLWLSCKSLPNIHAWHLCQHSDSITSDPRKCILSLAYYLSTHLPDYFEKLKELNLDEMINSANVNALFTRLLIEPLKELKPRETPIVILIDAIDESTTENGDNPIAKFIGSHFNDFPTWVRLIITSRPVYEVEKWFKCLNPQVLHTTDERNLNDISLYIQNRLKKHSFSTDVSESITRSILQRSEGVFLYAEFICNSIDSKEIDPLDINHFPKGLYNVYEDYFQRRFPDIQQYKSGVAHLLRLIVAAKEPLLIDDINNFLESKLDDWDEECFEDMRKSLGSLFVLIDDTIVPFHKSIIDWLVQNRESDYYINRKKANRNMIEWGERMIKSRRGVSEYFLKHLLAHYVYDKQFDSAIDLLQNQIYFNLQVAMLGFDQTIRLYFDNLLLFHDYSPQSVVLVLQSSFFIQLINNYRRYFLDNGYYMDIKAMGFDQVVDSLLKHEDLKIIITAVLYYYYSLENFNRVIKLTEQYVIDNQLYESLDDITISQIYEVYGLSLRKLGLFTRAEHAFEQTLLYGQKIDSYYQMSLGYANLAKLAYHRLDFEKGYYYNTEAYKCLSLSYDEAVEQALPIATSIKLFLAEYKRLSAENYLFGKEYQKAESELKVAAAIYDEVVFRDRYYVRFIYTSALLNLFSNNLLDAEHLLLKAETLSRNNYDKATVLYYKSILDLLQNNDIKATELSERAAQIFSKIYSCIEQVEALIINAISKRSNQTIEIQPEHFDWYQYVFNLYTNHLIKTINGNQNIGEWRLDTDSTKKHLFIYYKK